MRRLSFLLCLALLVSQLGFVAGAVASVWTEDAERAVLRTASASKDARIGCGGAACEHAGDPAGDPIKHCDVCQACHGCHAPMLPSDHADRLTTIPAQPAPSTSAVGHVSTDHPPDIKPPIL